MTTITDTRMRRPDWSAAGPARARRRWIRFLLVATVPLALFYFAWLLQPQRIGGQDRRCRPGVTMSR